MDKQNARRPARGRPEPTLYNGLTRGIPEALHETLIQTRDVSEGTAWLRDGAVPDGVAETPEPGARIATPGRRLLRVIGRDDDGTRWAHVGRSRGTRRGGAGAGASLPVGQHRV